MSIELPKRVIAIDDDEVVLTLLSQILKKLGIKEVDSFTDPKEAWERLCDDSIHYDLICSDWKMPGLSGIALFNRIRSQSRYSTAPILIISGFINQNDFKLLEEFPVTRLVEKPFQAPQIKLSIEKLMESSAWYNKNEKLLAKLLETSVSASSGILQSICQTIENSPDRASVAILTSRILRSNGQAELALKIVDSLLATHKECVPALAEKGRNLFSLGRYKESISILKYAHGYSPENVERLCMIGEGELKIGDFKGAEATFESAMELDHESEQANAGHEIAQHAQDFFITKKHPITHNFASNINMLGVAYVNAGRLSKGVKQYQNALKFIEDDYTTARISFNLGLAYLKHGDKDSAKNWFEKSATRGGEKFARGKEFLNNIDEKMAQKVPEESIESTNSTHDVAMASLANSGDADDQKILQNLQESFESDDDSELLSID